MIQPDPRDEQMLPDDPSAPVSNRPSAAKTNPEPKTTDVPDRPAEAERPRLELTATQILAGIAASVTAAILGSRLGVAGTVLGAALASGVSITGGAVYAHSIRATRHRMRRAVNRWRPDGPPVPQSNNPFAPVRVPGDVGRMDLDGRERSRPRPSRAGIAVLSPGAPVGRPRRSAPTRSPSPKRRPWWSGLAVGIVGTAVVFGAALALVTGIEVVKGSPLSGGATGGLSVLGGSRAGGSAPDPASPAKDVPATSSAASDPTTRVGTDQPSVDPTSATGVSGTSAVPTAGPGPGGASASTGNGGATSRIDPPDPAGNAEAGGDGGAVAGGSRTAAGTATGTAAAGATGPSPTSGTASPPTTVGTGTGQSGLPSGSPSGSDSASPPATAGR
jgi:hypothetical protein